MANRTQTLEQEYAKAYTHRAFYHAVSKQRWSVFQKRELQFWKRASALKARQVHTRRYYLPLLKPLMSNYADDMSILEIGSGPVCTAQYLDKGTPTYIDPLMDDYRRLFPGTMPEESTYITAMAEKHEWGDSKFDVILCLNTLSDVHNPELVLNNVKEVLNDGGTFVVSLDLWPSWLARAHYLLSRFAPGIPRVNNLYSYTKHGFCNSLLRHFKVESERFVKPRFSWVSLKKEMLFVCTPKTAKIK